MTRAHDTIKNKPVDLEVTRLAGDGALRLRVATRMTTKQYVISAVEADRSASTVTIAGATYCVEEPSFFDEFDAACDELAVVDTRREQRAQDPYLVEEHRRQARADSLPTAFTQTYDQQRWQYAVINTGTFDTGERLREMLTHAGAAGWELVTVYDKASNWWAGFEKGFMLMKRPIPADTEPEEWCVLVRG